MKIKIIYLEMFKSKIYETAAYSHTIDCILYKRADHNTLPNHIL
jgi:hypothetical protein